MRSSEQTVKGPADLSKLRSNVVQFCGGLPIYELEILEKDGITVLHGELPWLFNTASKEQNELKTRPFVSVFWQKLNILRICTDLY